MSRYDVLFMNGKSLMFWALDWIKEGEHDQQGSGAQKL